MLFVDYSSAFKTIIPSKLTLKLENLGFSPTLHQWIYNFLSDRPQAVRVGRQISSSLTLSTGAPQGCVLSPLLYSLYSHPNNGLFSLLRSGKRFRSLMTKREDEEKLLRTGYPCPKPGQCQQDLVALHHIDIILLYYYRLFA